MTTINEMIRDLLKTRSKRTLARQALMNEATLGRWISGGPPAAAVQALRLVHLHKARPRMRAMKPPTHERDV